jgi:transposase
LASLTIVGLEVTKGTKHDSPILERLMKKVPDGKGSFCADSAYLSRKNCKMVYGKGRTPFIKPKKNTRMNKKGCQPWRDMIALYLEDKKAFMKRYHDRSKVESVYSVLKTCFGNHLSSKRRSMQMKELYLKATAYNIGRVNLHQVKMRLKKGI